MDPINEAIAGMTRRHFFGRTALGLGGAALAKLLPGIERGLEQGIAPHFAPKAKRAIWLFMAGAPSQIDMFDYKPRLEPRFDEDLPDSIRMGQRLTTMTSGQKRFPVAPSMYKFEKYDNGDDGAWVSELLPYTAQVVDKLAIVRSMWTHAINHDPAITFICTGREQPGWPSLGSWLSYGLGSENHNLPTFVVLTSTWTGRREAQALYNRLWGSGMLPSEHQGVALRSQGDPVLFLTNPEGVDGQARRRMLDVLAELNERRLAEVGDPETRTRIQQYEMAFRMQTSVPELCAIENEPQHIRELYGPDIDRPGTFAHHCLLARRMIERGVRFVQIFHRGWDQHAVIPTDLPNQCRDTDQPAAALIRDLEQRGLLDETLVIWGGEFGRTVYCQGQLTKTNYGRDHHPKCFTVWMAGGGIRGGQVYGATDDYSYNIVENPVHIRDLNATILHCLGIDHERLSLKHQGLDVRLTSVEPARVVRDLLV